MRHRSKLGDTGLAAWPGAPVGDITPEERARLIAQVGERIVDEAWESTPSPDPRPTSDQQDSRPAILEG